MPGGRAVSCQWVGAAVGGDELALWQRKTRGWSGHVHAEWRPTFRARHHVFSWVTSAPARCAFCEENNAQGREGLSAAFAAGPRVRTRRARAPSCHAVVVVVLLHVETTRALERRDSCQVALASPLKPPCRLAVLWRHVSPFERASVFLAPRRAACPAGSPALEPRHACSQSFAHGAQVHGEAAWRER